jgi:hypothetical protein
MKTMSCRDLGEPCDFAHQGSTADGVIKAQDKHLRGDRATNRNFAARFEEQEDASTAIDFRSV